MKSIICKIAVICCALAPISVFGEECISFNPIYNTELEWDWHSGASTPNEETHYSGENQGPGARYGSVRWIDTKGDTWLFGGAGRGAAPNSWGHLSDLWKLDSSTKKWIFVSGNNTLNTDTGVIPGARWGASGWSDSSGNLYLFGGINNRNEALNDLWKYNISVNSWTFIAGTKQVNRPSNFTTNEATPGGRWASASWSDKDGNLWLYGGGGYSGTSGRGNLGDFWKFNTHTSKWSFVSGEQYGTNSNGVYDSIGENPGARYYSSHWTDNAGNFWLFGGSGMGKFGTEEGRLNDLWKYDIVTKTWLFMSGSQYINPYGTYNTFQYPGGRIQSSHAVDREGNFWLYGGTGYGYTGLRGTLADLWRYNVSENKWSFVGGNNLPFVNTNLAASPIVAGSREFSSMWADKSGYLWLFGGYYSPSTRNDLLAFDIFDSIDIETSEDESIQQAIDNIYDPLGKGKISIETNPVHGVASLVDHTTSILSYTPRSNFNGYDRFVIRLDSKTTGCVEQSTATVYVRVTPEKDCPEFSWGQNSDRLLEWNWQGGSSSNNDVGVYTGDSQVPGARYGSVQWTDSDGNLWLFGGAGRSDFANSWGYLADLWMYDTKLKKWNFVSGSKNLDIPNGSSPGGRWAAMGWYNADNLYLFGGSNRNGNFFSDLWKFNINSKQWILINGDSTLDRASVYTGLNQRPGGRWSSMSWFDKSGKLWLYGGNGFGSNNLKFILNDLWMFDLETNSWSFAGAGTTAGESRSVYNGNQWPGSRVNASAWIHNNDLWLFGGQGYGQSGSSGRMNDLWKFDLLTKKWSFVSGDKFINARARFETNLNPGARYYGATASTPDGNLWLFGGSGYGSGNNIGSLNDLWKFDTESLTWMFVSGSQTVNSLGEFSGSEKYPSARYFSNLWNDNFGNLWMFGGNHLITNDIRNDLWSISVVPKLFEMSMNANTPGILKITSVNDPDGVGIINAYTNGISGTVSKDSLVTNTLIYTPNQNFVGTDQFVISLSSTYQECDVTTALVKVKVKAPEPMIHVANVNTITPLNTNVVIDLPISSQLSDGYFITSIVSQPLNGQIAFSSYQKIVYVPNTNFQGIDQFSYQVKNGIHSSGTAEVRIVVGNGGTASVKDWTLY